MAIALFRSAHHSITRAAVAQFFFAGRSPSRRGCRCRHRRRGRRHADRRHSSDCERGAPRRPAWRGS